MRIISGEAKGRTLYAPQGGQTRPTSDKIRGSVFNIIGSRVADARVLDLFGGTGALALEALSRGADSAVIADAARAAVQVIERNARAVLQEGFDRRVQILRADYRTAIDKAEGVFDLVFLDPPYRMAEAYGDALSRLAAAGKLGVDCLIVMERLKSNEIKIPARFERYDVRAYGDTAVEFVRECADQPRETI
ncbi:MAG: 16S rRNA (guanine(966)-N(2))-methyltransferase RsmD [Clostridia bacterium]|nr:16S rRNA (guanine(966)-N(2))-methyltransferase RsmD [Clostridia bacterium]